MKIQKIKVIAIVKINFFKNLLELKDVLNDLFQIDIHASRNNLLYSIVLLRIDFKRQEIIQ